VVRFVNESAARNRSVCNTWKSTAGRTDHGQHRWALRVARVITAVEATALRRRARWWPDDVGETAVVAEAVSQLDVYGDGDNRAAICTDPAAGYVVNRMAVPDPGQRRRHIDDLCRLKGRRCVVSVSSGGRPDQLATNAYRTMPVTRYRVFG